MAEGRRGSGSMPRLCSVETSLRRSSSVITSSSFLAAFATAASSSDWRHSPSATGSIGCMFWMFQWVRSRIDWIVGLVVPTSFEIWPSDSSGWNFTSHRIEFGRS